MEISDSGDGGQEVIKSPRMKCSQSHCRIASLSRNVIIAREPGGRGREGDIREQCLEKKSFVPGN